MIVYISSKVVKACFLLVILTQKIKGDCSISCEDSDCPCQCYHNELRCSNRSITEIAKYPMHMEIRALELDHNQISVIGENSFNQKSLTNLLGLRLSANRIKRLRSGSFLDVKYLEMLFLNHNYIEDISEDAFVGLKNLRRLYLNDNKIRSLPVKVFNPLKANLRLLYLHGNRIENIPSELLQNFKHLETIDISRNRITKMDGRFFSSMPLLRNVFFQNNPWSCDAGTVCSTIGTFRKIRKRREEPEHSKRKIFFHKTPKPLVVYGGMMCASPVEYMGLMAESLLKNFKCHDVNLMEYFHVITIHDSQKDLKNGENNGLKLTISSILMIVTVIMPLLCALYQ